MVGLAMCEPCSEGVALATMACRAAVLFRTVDSQKFGNRMFCKRLRKTLSNLFAPAEVTGLAAIHPRLRIIERVPIIVEHHYLTNGNGRFVIARQFHLPLFHFLEQPGCRRLDLSC